MTNKLQLKDEIDFFFLLFGMLVVGVAFYLYSKRLEKTKAGTADSKKALDPMMLAIVLISGSLFWLFCAAVFFFFN